MTRTQPNLLLFFFFLTKPNPPSPKNGLGWVGTVLAGWWVGCTPLNIVIYTHIHITIHLAINMTSIIPKHKHISIMATHIKPNIHLSCTSYHHIQGSCGHNESFLESSPSFCNGLETIYIMSSQGRIFDLTTTVWVQSLYTLLGRC